MVLTSSIWLIFFQISVISRSTKILIVLNFWLGMYGKASLKMTLRLYTQNKEEEGQNSNTL